MVLDSDGGILSAVHEEKDLSQLELEWGQVQIQTSWKLEPCYKWSDDAHPPFQESQTQEGD